MLSSNRAVYDKASTTIANILESAEALFTSKNYADVTMTEIAERCAVTKGALYHYFDSKEELYLVMMHEYLQRIQAMMSEVIVSEANCRQQLKQLALWFLQLPELQQDLMRLVRRDVNVLPNAKREQFIKAYQAALPEQAEKIIAQGIAGGEIVEVDARLLSWQYVAIVEVVLRPYARTAITSNEAMAEFITKLFFDGVGQSY